MTTATCEKPTTAKLPTPAERPESDVVIYDGECRICTAQVRKLPWWDCQQKLSYLSLHDPEVARRWPDLSHDRMMQEMVIVDHYGNRHWGPEAIRYLTRRLRRLWWAAPYSTFRAACSSGGRSTAGSPTIATASAARNATKAAPAHCIANAIGLDVLTRPSKVEPDHRTIVAARLRSCPNRKPAPGSSNPPRRSSYLPQSEPQQSSRP